MEENQIVEEFSHRRFQLNKKTVVKIIAVVLAVLTVFEIAVSFILYSAILTTNGSPSFMAVKWPNSENNKWLTENAENVQLINRDGVNITGLEITNSNPSDSYVIICHPYGKTADQMGDFARHFYDLGFNVLLPDARGFGNSPYKEISFGYLDRLDVVDWVNSIVEKDEAARIVLFGVSIGGACVAGASAEDVPTNVKCVIADSSYATVYDLFKEEFEDNFKLPTLLTVNILSLINELKCGWGFKDASILKLVEASKVPVLFIHGENDEVIFIKQSNDLFMACGNENREQLIVNEAEHGTGYLVDGNKYWATVDGFLISYLEY